MNRSCRSVPYGKLVAGTLLSCALATFTPLGAGMLLIPAGRAELSSTVLPAGESRAVGACCYHDADGVPVCVVTSFQECRQFFHGVYAGDGTNCDPAPCADLPTGACCYQVAGGAPQCAVLYPLECEYLQGVYQGNGTTCNPDPCESGSGMGACCYREPGSMQWICAIMSAQECEFLQGLYQGDGTPCDPDPCEPTTGACCYRDPATGQWGCAIVTAADCDLLYGGIYQGDGSNCGPPLPCESHDPKGACCYVDAEGISQCVIVSAYECDTVYFGAYQGDGSSCTPDPCTDEGACCFFEGGQVWCVVTTAIDCETLYHGQFQGTGTNCDPPWPCDIDPPTGACCYGTPPNCTIVSQFDCEHTLGGTYMGDGVPCTPNPCPEGEVGACCVVDAAGNHVCVTATQAQCEELLLGVYFGDGSLCTPELCPEDPRPCDCVSECDAQTPQYEDPTFAGFTGASVVATEFDQWFTNFVLVVTDIKNKGTAPLNVHWAAATRYSHPSWTPTNLGSPFGVTVDDMGNIYVTASTSYSGSVAGPGGWGAVYKIDANTGGISTFATLPNTGPGLGNICFDSARAQFFVTNFEDGRIYRLDMAGNCLSTFDHATGLIGGCAPEAGDPPGFASLNERPWGVAVYNNRVYYGIWAEDMGRPSLSDANTIWSIALSGGDFSGAAQQEIVLPVFATGYAYSSPPSQISFSRTGCMLVAERSMYLDNWPSAHQSRVLEYRQIGPVWWPSSNIYDIGFLWSGSGTNAAGGADFDEDGDVWATGDALQFAPQTIYGLQGLPCTGGDVTQSILVDLNGFFTTADKTQIGALKVTCFTQCTPPPRRMVAWFPLDETSGTTATDIAWGNSGTYTGTTAIAGYVQGAHRFNGTSDFAKVPNAPQLNFGAGNFSVDLWLRSTNLGLPVILDKRGPAPQGYSVFLYQGRPGLQLADGSSFANFIPPNVIADGTWHHLAISVNRTSASGVRFFIDGSFVAAYNPLPYAGSLTNPNPLWIGVREPALGGSGYFEGDLDEIEIFRGVLKPEDILRIFRAGHAGKCKERAYLPPVTTYCPWENVKAVPFTIFNDSTSTFTHNWALLGNTSCAVPGPTAAQFSPQNMSGVVIPGGFSQSWTINITRPAGLVPWLTACYDATVLNTTLGFPFGTSAALKAIGWKWCFIVLDPDIGVATIPFPHGASVGFAVTNQDSASDVLEYRIVARATDGDQEDSVVRLNGLPPGEPVIDTIQVGPGETVPLTVDVSFAEHEAFVLFDIVLLADADGDGEFEPMASVGVRSVLPDLVPGDLNCDGAVNAFDIDPFVLALTAPDAYAATYPDCNILNADVNGDGVVNAFDIDPFVDLLTGG